VKRFVHDDLEQDVQTLITAAFFQLDLGHRQIAERLGLALAEYWTLLNLDAPEGGFPSELARRILRDKSTMTGVVDSLEGAGLVERRRDPSGDRRFMRIVLTPEGERRRRAALDAQEAMLAERFGRLDGHELSQLRASLLHLVDGESAQAS
jgi:DNA-binding MarR family transcriptional regulator